MTNDTAQEDSTQLWYKQPVEDVLKTLQTDVQSGLGSDAVARSRDEHGSNSLSEAETHGWLYRLFKQFKNPLVLILLVAGIVTLAIGYFIDAAVIAFALLVNVVIGTIQEGRASQAFQALSDKQSTQARVIRGGQKQVIPAEDVVVGDLVLLDAGMSVPADMRLVEEHNLKMNESALTGEWMTIEKGTKPIGDDTAVPDRTNMAWKGTLVSSGEGKGVVTAVGDNTEVGKIAQELASGVDTETPIQRHMRQLARFVAVVSLVAVAVIFVLGLVRGQPLLDMLVFSIAVAVSVVPEGLPAAVTVVLALGMERILDRGGLVRNLRAAETLGSTTTILTDKTGTLTKAQMTVDELLIPGEDANQGDTLSGRQLHLLMSGIANTDAFVENTEDGYEVHGEPIEQALIDRGRQADVTKEELDQNRDDFIAFSSENRFSVNLRRSDEAEGGHELTVSGAPEVILENCNQIATADGKRELTDKERQQVKKLLSDRSAAGKRVIAVGYKETDKTEIPREEEGQPTEQAVSGLTFLGLISFVDPVREDVAQAIKQAKSAGVNVVMVTGDNAETANYIAQEAGVAEAGVQPVTGPEIDKMSDEEIISAVKNRNVFARVLPKQKLRVAKLLQDREEVVAMTGDGVNDAPALRAADIGVAVGSGTEVAREASDLVLLNDSFSIIVAAIEEGRRIIDNLKKIIAHLLSTSFGGLFLIGGALVAGLAIPITTPQILWVNIVEGGLLTFVFAAEPPAPGIMERDPSATRTRNLISAPMKWLIAASGTITGIAAFVVYVLLSNQGLPIETIRTMMFVILTIDALFFVVALKNFYKPFYNIDFSNNNFLFISLALSLIALLGAVFLPPLRNLLDLRLLSGWQWLLIAGIGIFDLLVVEFGKYWLFQRDSE